MTSALTSTLGLTALAVLVGLGGALALGRMGSGRLGGRSVLVAVAAVAVGTVVGTVLVVADGLVHSYLPVFALIHHAYLVGTVTVPLVGVGLGIALLRRGGARWWWALVAVMLLPAPVGAYATHIAPYRLEVDRHVVAIDPARAGEDDVRIAVLADLQTNGIGDHERAAVAAIMAAEPDVVVIPGDLFHGTRAELGPVLEDLRDLLGDVRAPHGVFFVRGDADGGGSDGLQGHVDTILDGLDHITVLDDEVAEVRVGDRTLVFGGTRLEHDVPDVTTPGGDRVRGRLLAQPADGAIAVHLSHRPDAVSVLPSASRVDLTIAGHTHGGQVALPLLGPPVTLSSLPRHVAAGGLHDVDGNAVYVSSGVGMERGSAPQVRFGTRPSIGVLDLREAPDG